MMRAHKAVRLILLIGASWGLGEPAVAGQGQLAPAKVSTEMAAPATSVPAPPVPSAAVSGSVLRPLSADPAAAFVAALQRIASPMPALLRLAGAGSIETNSPRPEKSADPGAADAVPEITGSLPETALPLPPIGTVAAVAPDRLPPPFLQNGAPVTATPAAPATQATPGEPSQKTPSPGTSSPGTSGTAAAPPPAPTFSERLHAALDAFAAAEIKGREAAEQHKIRAAVAAFYAAHNYAPLWVDKGKPNAAARSALDRLAHAQDDGLSLEGLPSPDFAEASSDDRLIKAEIDLDMQVVAYARQATGGRIDPQRIAALIGAKPSVAEPAQILGAMAKAGANAGSALESFNPLQPGYRALRDKLAELRRETRPMAAQPIPPGPALRIGMSDPRVPLIRARFGLDTEPAVAATDLLYDTRVAAAVAEFQKASGLPASGVLTARTIAALSGGEPSRLEHLLLANMEMWRWMPRDMGKDRIEVNIPNFTVSVFRDDQLVWRNKVIVGKPQTPTPVFSNVMRFLIVNPYWNVPPSIMRKEMLPHLAQDPTYLSRMGFEVFTRHGKLVVRQPPGDKNALGRIKFMFPNDYSVYLHDTPSRSLFAANRRAFSHGCVRVDDPFALAQAVLGSNSGWTEARVKRLIGGAQRYINLPEPLPIHIEYFTAFVDTDGRLQLRDDIYGYARKVEIALAQAK